MAYNPDRVGGRGMQRGPILAREHARALHHEGLNLPHVAHLQLPQVRVEHEHGLPYLKFDFIGQFCARFRDLTINLTAICVKPSMKLGELIEL
jgi:hypothetical protein